MNWKSEWKVLALMVAVFLMCFYVMVTPALAIDGDVKSVGKVLSKDELKKLLTGKEG